MVRSSASWLRHAVAGATTALALATAHGASALPPDPVAIGAGLAEPAGIARTPDGALWTSDGALGVCRVAVATQTVEEDGVWCSSLGSRIGAPGQMAFDPESSSFYVADGKENTGGIWRLHWNAATGAIADGLMILATPNDRPLGLALSPTGPAAEPGGPPSMEVDFSSKRTNLIRRIHEPGGAATVDTVGSSVLPAAPSLAHLGDALYIAEPSGVTVIAQPGSADTSAQPVPTFPGGIATAVAADPARGRVYAGTTNGNAQDQVDVLDAASGAVETYATGFAAVTALADDGGTLLAGDDPASASGAQGASGGRLWSVPLMPLGRPHVTIVQAPASIERATSVHFIFNSGLSASLECRLDGAPWQSCGTAGSGERTYDNPAEGVHAFEVRAVDPTPLIGAGEVTRRTFVIDRTPPSATLDNPPVTVTVGSPAVFAFSANELGVTYQCRLDQAAWETCTPPRQIDGLAKGTHAFSVIATDLAGNVGALAPQVFEVVPPPALPPSPAAAPAAKPVSSITAVPAPSSGAMPKPSPCSDPRPSAVGFGAGTPRATRRTIRLIGWARDTRCAPAAMRLKVEIAIAQRPTSNSGRAACRFLDRRGRLSSIRDCQFPIYQRATDTGAGTWARSVRILCCRPLPAGKYVVFARLVPVPGAPAMAPVAARFRVL